MTVWVTSDYTGDITTTAWTQLAVAAPGSNYAFVSSGDVDLSQYVGGNVYVAFKYVSTNTNAATWEVKNFVVSE